MNKEVEVCEVDVFFVFFCAEDDTDVHWCTLKEPMEITVLACSSSGNSLWSWIWLLVVILEDWVWLVFLFANLNDTKTPVTPTNRPIRTSRDFNGKSPWKHLAIFKRVHGVIARSSNIFTHYFQAFLTLLVIVAFDKKPLKTNRQSINGSSTGQIFPKRCFMEPQLVKSPHCLEQWFFENNPELLKQECQRRGPIFLRGGSNLMHMLLAILRDFPANAWSLGW